MAYNKPDVWIRQSIKLRLGTVPPSPRRICIIGPVYHIVRDEEAAKTGYIYNGSQLEVPYPDNFDSSKEDVMTDDVVVKINVGGYEGLHQVTLESVDTDTVTIKANEKYTKQLAPQKMITLSEYVDTTNTLNGENVKSVWGGASYTHDSQLQIGQLVKAVTDTAKTYYGIITSLGSTAVKIMTGDDGAGNAKEVTIDGATDGNIKYTIYPRRISEQVAQLDDLDGIMLSPDGTNFTSWNAVRIKDVDGNNNTNIEAQLTIFACAGSVNGSVLSYDVSTDTFYNPARSFDNGDLAYIIDTEGNITKTLVVKHNTDDDKITFADKISDEATKCACMILKNFGTNFYYYPIDQDAPVNGEVYVFYHALRKDIVGEANTFDKGVDLVDTLDIPCDQNPTVLAAYNAMSCGVPVTVMPTSGTDLTSFQEVEEKLDILDAYYFVPVTTDSDVHSWLKNKVEAWSDPTYKKEAVAILGLYESSTDKNTIINNVKTYAQNLGSRRVVVVWPDRVTVPGYNKEDGSDQDYNMYGDQLAAIVAGHLARSAREVYESLTATSLSVVKNISRTNDLFTEAELNSIAEGGVFIVTKHYNLFRVRHALTTDMSQVETREITITETIDTIAKSLRAMLVGMIGKPISPALLGSIRFAVERQLDYYFKYGYISDFKINSIKQSESNPDTIEVDLSVKPTYPCNYINVVLYIG